MSTRPLVRTVTTHHDGLGLNDRIIIKADKRDAENGGASHEYACSMDVENNGYIRSLAHIQFQHGPRLEKDSTPGVTDAALLAILIDRYEGFQAGPFACVENDAALKLMQAALSSMRNRANKRAVQGVLGKNEAHDSDRVDVPDEDGGL